MNIVRTEAEITAAWDRAQTAAFHADDNDQDDPAAQMAYNLLQYLTGNAADDPTLELAELD